MLDACGCGKHMGACSSKQPVGAAGAAPATAANKYITGGKLHQSKPDSEPDRKLDSAGQYTDIAQVCTNAQLCGNVVVLQVQLCRQRALQ